MVEKNNPPIRRVISSNGSAWRTDAQGAADYLFNPVFMTYFVLCVTLYATMMQPSEETSLPLPAQMILWGGLIMTSLIWLFLSTYVSVVAFDRGWTKAIYTPLLLLPLVFINVFLGEYVLSIFNTTFQGSYGSRLENFVQNAIVLIVFDILHARFVVSHHPRYVAPFSRPDGQVQRPAPVTATPPAAPNDVASATHPAVAAVQDEQVEGVALSLSCAEIITMGREDLDATAILWIKSEDHYLSFQMQEGNRMLRGKLRTVANRLGDARGLQINRSVWVAYAAIHTVEEPEPGRLELSMQDGSVFRVSGARRLMFVQNYERYQAEHSPD